MPIVIVEADDPETLSKRADEALKAMDAGKLAEILNERFPHKAVTDAWVNGFIDGDHSPEDYQRRVEQNVRYVAAQKVSELRDPKPISPDGERLLQFFAWKDLPPDLQAIVRPFAELATAICSGLPPNAERHEAIKSLLLAKDHAVRAKLWR